MELLAPAGNREAFLAALANGADAVYLGGQSFSARQYAENFSLENISDALDYAHLRKKKVYVTVNTLIADEEFSPALDYIWTLYRMGVDAVIVQDLGLVQALHQLIPDLRLHASTQMTIHNTPGAELLRGEGIRRIVLAREMTRDELAEVCGDNKAMEFEVFVHGALCFSYSGQCLFSSLVGGRSGNRGRCAQPCRLPYQLFSRESAAPVASNGRHLLSPADLCLIEELADLQKIGVHSLKIEGRMKRPEYVAIVTRAYREVLDSLAIAPSIPVSPELKKRLAGIFNRNFTSGYYLVDKVGYFSPQRPNNRGKFAGRVVEQKQDLTTHIKLTESLRAGDGLEIWVNKGRGPAFIVKELILKGEKVFKAEPGDTVSLTIDGRVGTGDRVFKTYDSELMGEAQATIEEAFQSKLPLDVQANLQEGKPLELIISCDEEGKKVRVESPSCLQKAEKHPLNYEVLREKVGRLGNTPFYLRRLSLVGNDNLMIPFSELNETRRRGSDAILELLRERPFVSKEDEQQFNDTKASYIYFLGKAGNQAGAPSPRPAKSLPFPLLSLSVAGIAEGHAALEAGADRVYLHMRGLGQANAPPRKNDVKGLITAAERAGRQIIPLLPRISRPSAKPWPAILPPEAISALMVGNLGDLHICLNRGIDVYTDYSLNAFNSFALGYLLELGVKGVCISPELNWKQLQSLTNIDKVEMLIHGDLLLMTSRHCILESILGKGESICPGYCRKDDYYLRDEKGFEFPILSDKDCRFYLLNSRTLCMMEDLDKLILSGAGSFRIEAYRYNEKQVSQITAIYRKALQEIKWEQRPDLAEYKQQLQDYALSPFTKGHYYRGVQ